MGWRSARRGSCERGRFFSGVFGTWVLAMLLVTVATAAGARTTITYFGPNQEDWIAWSKETVKAFEAKHPDIKVDVVYGDMQKLLVSVAGGSVPDVIHIDGGLVPLYSQNGLFRPLDDLIRNDKSFDVRQYFPELLRAMQWKGKQYALPRAWGAVALVYNRRLIDEAGVSYPNENWTWDSLVTAGKKLTRDLNGDNYPDVFGFYDSWGNANRFPIWIWQAGGDIWTADFTDTVIDSPAALNGLRFYYELYYRHHIGPRVVGGTPFDEPGINTGNQDELFRTSKVAMVHSTRYFSPDQVSWDIAPLAKGPAGRHTMLIPSAAGIFSDAPHLEEAWEFLKFFVSDEGFLAGDKLSPMRPVYQGAIPPTLSLAREWLTRRKDIKDYVWLLVAEQGRLNTLDNPLATLSYRSNIAVALNAAAQGQKSLEQAIREVADQWRTGLRQALKR